MEAIEHPWIKGKPAEEEPAADSAHFRLSTASFGEEKNQSKDFTPEMMECEEESPRAHQIKRLPREGVAHRTQNKKKLLNNQMSTLIGSSLAL